MRHFRYICNETTGEELTNHWGTSIFYFETDDQGDLLRQIQVFEKGQVLKYSEAFMNDEFGMLADQPMSEYDFQEFAIGEDEFENVWNNSSSANGWE